MSLRTNKAKIGLGSGLAGSLLASLMARRGKCPSRHPNLFLHYFVIARASCIALFSAIAISGCQTARVAHVEEWDALSYSSQREQIVNDAQGFRYAREYVVGAKRFPYDCSGFVGAILLKSGIDVFLGADELSIRGNGVKILYEFVHRYGELHTKGTPQPGDLVFFSNTYDRNRDGKSNDPLTHVGIVEKIDPDQTVTFIHNVHRGVRRYVMNLEFPYRSQDPDGNVINSYLRRRKKSDGRNTPYLAGSLFVAFGSLSRDRMMAQNWPPES